MAGYIEAIRPALESLADTAQRVRPNKDNLFVSVVYDRAMSQRVQDHIERWGRKQLQSNASVQVHGSETHLTGLQRRRSKTTQGVLPCRQVDP